MAVNCAAIVDTLLESELFGHEKGALPAPMQKTRKIRMAQDGTLFLDEIGNWLHRCRRNFYVHCRNRYSRRVGGTQQISTNARILSATNRICWLKPPPAVSGRIWHTG